MALLRAGGEPQLRLIQLVAVESAVRTFHSAFGRKILVFDSVFIFLT